MNGHKKIQVFRYVTPFLVANIHRRAGGDSCLSPQGLAVQEAQFLELMYAAVWGSTLLVIAGL